MEHNWTEQFDAAGRRAVSSVVDLDAPTRTCPACETNYAAGPVKCPGCGLFLGG